MKREPSAGPKRSLWSDAKSVYGFIALAVVAGVYAGFYFEPPNLFSNKSGSPSLIIGGASIIDGDSISVDGKQIRLHGIDAPEGRQVCGDASGRPYRCGELATSALANKIGQQDVSCEQRDIDRYGRIVAVCRVGGEDLSDWMVRQGWAVAYRRYSRDYVSGESAARSAKRGIWSGEFTLPEQWRRLWRRKRR